MWRHSWRRQVRYKHHNSTINAHWVDDMSGKRTTYEILDAGGAWIQRLGKLLRLLLRTHSTMWRQLTLGCSPYSDYIYVNVTHNKWSFTKKLLVVHTRQLLSCDGHSHYTFSSFVGEKSVGVQTDGGYFVVLLIWRGIICWEDESVEKVNNRNSSIKILFKQNNILFHQMR